MDDEEFKARSFVRCVVGRKGVSGGRRISVCSFRYEIEWEMHPKPDYLIWSDLDGVL